MEKWLNALAAADEAYLIGMSNKGIYKRACKDAQEAEASVTYAADCAAVSIGGEVCQIRDPLWESSCSCPSRSVCRHLIAAMLWLKDHSEEQPSADAPEESFPETLRNALTAFPAEKLKSIFSGKWRTLVGQLSEIRLEEGSVLAGTLPDGTAVRLLYPLEGSSCSCHKKDICPHKAAVIAAWQVKEGLLSPGALQPEQKALPAAEADRIRESAARSYALLCEVLHWGLVRLPENIADHMEVAAVQSHALKMADAERALRDIGSRLSDSRSRRAVFRNEMFLRKLCSTARMLERLQDTEITETQLGEFRQSYSDYPGDLHLLPLGLREVQGEYEGRVYYFLDLDETAERRFYTLSDIRPAFYEGVKQKRRATMVWDLNVPLRSLMRSRLVLRGAKVNGGKLSASQETRLVSQTEANLDCTQVRELLHTDLRELAVWLSEQGELETDRLCLVHPAACTGCQFDTHTQQLEIKLLDHAGDRIAIRVRYRAETKKLISQLEGIARKMLEHPEKDYVWLCTAQFEGGKLTLFPIDMYDFIHTPEPQPYTLPTEFCRRENRYAPEILQFLDEVENSLCALLQSGVENGADKQLAGSAERFGMHGLAGLLRTLFDETERFRHSTDSGLTAVMQAMTAVQHYTAVGRKKLELICALQAMSDGSML